MTRSVAGLDLAALERFFAGHVPGPTGPLTASLITGGKSNLTYRVTDGARTWVVRRPPLGPLTPTAHDMGREYRVIAALHPTAVPVPEPVALCEDPGIIGAPFSVMSYVDGRTLQDGDDAAALPEAAARTCAATFVDTLVELHAASYSEVGLAEFGRANGYLARQVRRWREQWDLVTTRELESIGRLHAALASEVPEQAGATIVHGDYRLDNVIFDRSEMGRIAAVVDWEMATLGDPLADLGLLLVYWDPRTEPVLGVRHAPSANAGFPGAAELADRYALRSNRSLENLAFYMGLGYFKLAVIAEGIHQRYVDGQTVGDRFHTVGSAVPALLDAGLDVLRP